MSLINKIVSPVSQTGENEHTLLAHNRALKFDLLIVIHLNDSDQMTSGIMMSLNEHCQL